MHHAEPGLPRARWTAGSPGVGMDHPSAADQVTLLYRLHGMDLIRIAAVMLGSRAAAEDAVQDAFCGLFRKWHQLSDPAKALPYVRSAVMNQIGRASCRERV